MGAPSSSMPSSPSRSSISTPRKRDPRNLPSHRNPLTPLSANCDPGPSERKNMSNKARTPRSPVKLDAGVDRSTIRPSTPRSSSSPGHLSSQRPSTSRSPSQPLFDASHNAGAAPARPRRPSMVLYGPTFPAPVRPSQNHKRQASQVQQIGPFKFLRALPQGMFGKTLIARDTSSGRVLCTRVFEKGKMRQDAGFHSALLTEFLCYKHISGRSVSERTFLMEMHAVLQDEENVVFVMPLMQCDLLAAIRGRGERPRTRRWIAQVALGLDALHNMGIIHRDIKPENILLDARTDTVRIADFNAAYLHPGNSPLGDGEVYTREYIGSKPYLAPEVARRNWYGKMVDWWALGCLMFDLISGEVLFPTETQRSKYVKWDAKKEGTSYLRWSTDLSREEESALLGLLHLSPRLRFQLKDLQRQRYFLDEKGANVFHTLKDHMHRSPSVAAPTARDDGSAEVSPALQNLPLCSAVPRPCPTDAEGAYQFPDFAWVNPRGLWGFP